MNSILLTFSKTTKNFHKFDAVAPLLGSLYIPKEMMPEPPATIEVPTTETVA